MKAASYGGSGEARPDAKMGSENGSSTPAVKQAIKRKANAKRRRRDHRYRPNLGDVGSVIASIIDDLLPW